MKMLKKVLIPVLLVVTLMLTFALSSCKKECAHEYGEWSVTKDATCTAEGERSRTCSLCGEIETARVTAEGHATGELLCGKCGDEVVGAESLLPAFNPDTSSVGVLVKDVIITDVDDVDETVFTVDIAELVLYKGEGDELLGYGEATIIAKSGSQEFESVIEIFLENESIYGCFDSSNYDEECSYFLFTLDELMSASPVVSGAVEALATLLPSIEAWMNESLLPCFGEFTAPDGVDVPELNEASLKKAITTVLDLFFRVEPNENGAAVIFDLSIIKEVNNALNEKTVAELIDSLGGVGTFEQIEGLIPKMLDYTVSDLLKFIELNLGVDIPALLSALDELAVIVIGDDEATIEALLGLNEGIKIREYLEDEEFLALDVKTVLIPLLELEDEAELNAFVEQIVTVLKSSTLYGLLEVSQSDVALINDTVDELSESLSYVITVDKTGKFSGASLDASIPGANLYVTLELTEERILLNLNDGEETNSITVEIIPSYTPKPDTERQAVIKSELSGLPELTVEILALNELTPVLAEDGTIIGATEFGYLDYIEELDDSNVQVSLYVDVVDFSRAVSVTVSPVGCGEMYNYIYSYNGYTERRVYTVSKAAIEEISNSFDIDDEYDLAEWIVNNLEADYIEPDNSKYTETVQFGVDKATGEVSDEYSHDFSYDEDNSTYPGDMKCGDMYVDAYICTVCGATKEDKYFINHGENVIISAFEYDEHSNLCYAEYTCECGKYMGALEITFAGDVVITPKEGVGDEGDALDFFFTVESDGIYEITFSDASGEGYVHFYQKNTYIFTSYIEEEESSSTHSLYANDEAGYFGIYFHRYDKLNSVTITFTRVE